MTWTLRYRGQQRKNMLCWNTGYSVFVAACLALSVDLLALVNRILHKKKLPQISVADRTKNNRQTYWKNRLIWVCNTKQESLILMCTKRCQKSIFLIVGTTLPDSEPTTLSPRTIGFDPEINNTYTLSHPENGRDVTEHAQGYTLQCKMHPLCVNPGVPFWNREKTHKLRARWQASSSRIRADVTVVLEVRQSIAINMDGLKNSAWCYFLLRFYFERSIILGPYHFSFFFGDWNLEQFTFCICKNILQSTNSANKSPSDISNLRHFLFECSILLI